MASGHASRIYRPNTWLLRPDLRRAQSPFQRGAVHTWHPPDLVTPRGHHLEIGGGIVSQLSRGVGLWVRAEYTTDIGNNDDSRESLRGTAGCAWCGRAQQPTSSAQALLHRLQSINMGCFGPRARVWRNRVCESAIALLSEATRTVVSSEDASSNVSDGNAVSPVSAANARQVCGHEPYALLERFLLRHREARSLLGAIALRQPPASISHQQRVTSR